MVHQCLEFRTQEQRKSAQVHSSDWIWATSEYHNFWNQNFQLVFNTDLYNHSDLSAVTQHLLPHTRSSSHSLFTTQHCLEFGPFILQLIESSEFSFCLSTFTTLIRTWCVITSDDDNKEDDDNWSVQWWENSVFTRFWKEHDKTESQNSRRFSAKLTGLNLQVPPQSESLNSQCTRYANVSSHLVNMIDQADKQISVVVTTIKELIDEKSDESHACYLHRKKLAATAEFQVRLLWSDAVDSCLQTYWNNWFWILKLKTDSVTWWWFWAIDCSSQSADNMRVYNYLHHDLFLTIKVSALLNWINFKSGVWDRNESVVISNAFSWLYEWNLSQSTISIIIDDEF